MTRYFVTDYGLLTADEYHAIYAKRPACRNCGTPNLEEGTLTDDGECGECLWTREHPPEVYEPTEGERRAEAREKMAEWKEAR